MSLGAVVPDAVQQPPDQDERRGEDPEEDAKRFIAALETIYHAVSLGATETLICIPYLTTMLSLPPERRTVFGVRKNTVRLSVGIEPPEKLIKDLKQALACVAQGVPSEG